jgi:hypothetical protein
MSLDAIFSNFNMRAYSEACLNMAVDMAEVRRKKIDFDTLVIPSRGAFPFFLGMVHASRRLQNADPDIKWVYDNMAIQPTLEPLMPSDSPLSSDVHKKPLRVLLIPFTADLNIPKFDAEESNEEYTEQTREYWARVTHAFFRDPKLRTKNPYFRTFAETILRDIEGRSKTAEIYERFPTIGKFAIIDTVISGRASNDILGFFDQIALEEARSGGQTHDIPPYAFLIVDEKGDKLAKHPGFNTYLRDREKSRLAKLYPIPRIVSEDKNSALLGVSATIYPSLMKASKCIEYQGREFFIGAGSWHVNPESIQFKHFLKFMDMVYAGIDVCSADYTTNDEIAKNCLEDQFEEKRLDFITTTEDSGALNLAEFDVASDRRLAELNSGAVPTYETRSHVIHVPFNPRFDRNLIAKICNYDYVTCKKNPPPSDLYEDTGISNKRAAIFLSPSRKH